MITIAYFFGMNMVMRLCNYYKSALEVKICTMHQ